LRARGIEEGDRARALGLADIEELETCGLEAELADLVGHRHQLARDLEGVGAHLGVRQVGLHDDLRRARIAHIDRGEVLGRALVREPQHPAAVLGELHGHALAHPAEAVEAVVGKQLHVEEHGAKDTRNRGIAASSC
jgi:hypothetical protein